MWFLPIKGGGGEIGSKVSVTEGWAVAYGDFCPQAGWERRFLGMKRARDFNPWPSFPFSLPADPLHSVGRLGFRGQERQAVEPSSFKARKLATCFLSATV